MERIDESARRILALKETYRVGPASGADPGTIRGPGRLRIIAAIYEAVADRRGAQDRS